jgi:CDP-glucose 4,6-dehydratase
MDYPLGQRLRELPGPLLLTGHTGFKGTWMTFLLEHLNVPMVGYSLPPEKDSLYSRAEREGAIPEAFADIRDYEALEQFIDLHKPSTIIHMAAQPLVLTSYENPRGTFDVNVMGTVNVLDVAFKKDFVKAIIVVTTDKVYRNDNSGRAFIESDPLEGKDPYSASKVGAEAVVSAWQQISELSDGPKLFSVRAGNVIGGGDYAENRLFPDIAKSILSDDPVIIRNSKSTRPWQHVLDPLTGYLRLLEYSQEVNPSPNYNFGPGEPSLSVTDVVTHVKMTSRDIVTFEVRDDQSTQESQILNLEILKATHELNWFPRWKQEKAIEKTISWWQGIKDGIGASNLVLRDIENFLHH